MKPFLFLLVLGMAPVVRAQPGAQSGDNANSDHQMILQLLSSPTFALGGVFYGKVVCFQWSARLGLHYILR
jgi:hypothetical protein